MSKEPKLTEWQSPRTLPVRIGVYEIDVFSDMRWFRYWDGLDWHVGASSPALAVRLRSKLGDAPTRPWRGLAEPPT